MFLAIILYCAIPTDTTSCDVMVRKDHLFYSQVQCEKEIIPMAKGLMATGHFVKAKCFEFNPYGEEV